MDSCCTKAAEAALALKQGRVLRVVLGLNLGMFFIEAAAGVLARSSGLMGDSLDMLGDALAYAATLYVLHRSAVWKARATTLKVGLMALTAAGVLVSAVLRAGTGEAPSAEGMGGVGLVALLVNGVCLFLLTRHRADDANLSSAWVCSRNDLIANTSVIAAGGVVALTGSLWPDFVVGVGIALLFAYSALRALQSARATPAHYLSSS